MSETKIDKVDEVLRELLRDVSNAYMSTYTNDILPEKAKAFSKARAALAELVEGIPHDKNSADFNYALKQAADLLRGESK